MQAPHVPRVCLRSEHVGGPLCGFGRVHKWISSGLKAAEALAKCNFLFQESLFQPGHPSVWANPESPIPTL